MTTDKQLADTLSRWLEAEAPTRLPERVLDATFQRTRASRQQVGWRRFVWRLPVTGVTRAVATAVVVLFAVLALGLYVNRSGIGGPATPSLTPSSTSESATFPTTVGGPSAGPSGAPIPTPSIEPAPSAVPTPRPSATASGSSPPGFVGTWEGTDSPPDSSHLTMTVVAQPNGAFAVTLLDDSAAVCRATPSTMTGVAETTARFTYVIAQPNYVCDDGSPAKALSGPPLLEQLRDYTFVYDAGSDVLYDGGGLEFTRLEPAASRPPAPTASPSPSASSVAFRTSHGQA